MRLLALAALVCGMTLGAGACEADKPFGEIVLAVQTDVALPDSADQIRVEVLSPSGLVFGNDYTLGYGALTIPGTLGLLQGQDPSTPFLVRLIARKSGTVKMLREIKTTIPSRIATVRMPIRWLCDDSARETAPGQVVPATCQPGQTCIGGACYGSAIDPGELDDYDPAVVFDTCFDVLGCVGDGEVVVPDAACTIARPPGADLARLNVGLRVADDGVCDPSRQNCFVVLEPTTKPSGPVEGWRSRADDRIELAPGVCNRLQSGRVKQVVVSSRCERKKVGGPICGPWTGLQPPTGTPDAGPGDAGPTVDAGPPGTITTIVTGETNAGVTNQCAVSFVGDHVFFCSTTLPSASAYRLHAVALPPSAASSLVTPVTFESTIFGGPIVAADRLYWWNAVPNQASQIRFWNIDAKTLVVGSGAPIPRSSLEDSLPQPRAADAAYLYVKGLLEKVYRVPRAGGPAEELAATPTIGSVSYLFADEDTSGFVYVASGNQVERLSKTTPGTLLLGTVPEQAIMGMADGGDAIYLTARTGSDYWIYALPKTGGTPTKLLTGASFASAPAGLTVDGDFLYWHSVSAPTLGEKSIVRAPKAGGVAADVVEALVNDPSPEAKILGFAIRPDRIYYAVNYTEAGTPSFKLSAYTR